MTYRTDMVQESIYVPDRADAEPFPIDFDDGEQINLIERTGMENMRARMWYFEPGDSVTYHYHEEQEELFYVVEGTGHMLLGDEQELVEVPEGGMVKPATTQPRQLRNESDDLVVWLIIGAPPAVEGMLWDEYDEDEYPSPAGDFTALEEWF